ncbi:unnamed protein product [Moneuplotes crassus]|uniref:Uncharacterized protein n=1 Tax=Euplotes crassus TaxID=5936 RepID=A0AAD1U4Y8_EUPCR|nr:unnamed protein product [Moneuplotes crassus]
MKQTWSEDEKRGKRVERGLDFDSTSHNDSQVLTKKLIEILGFKKHSSNFSKLSLEQLQNIMAQVYQNKIIDQDNFLESEQPKRISIANILSHKDSPTKQLSATTPTEKILPAPIKEVQKKNWHHTLYHLSPTGILNKLDKCKYNWCKEKADRLKREDGIQATNKRVARISSKNIKNPQSISPPSSSLRKFRIEQKVFDDTEYRKNRKGLTSEEVSTYEQYIQKKFGILTKDTKNKKWEKEIKEMHLKTKSNKSILPKQELSDSSIKNNKFNKMFNNMGITMTDFEDSGMIEPCMKEEDVRRIKETEHFLERSNSKHSSESRSPEFDNKFHLQREIDMQKTRNTLDVFKSADGVENSMNGLLTSKSKKEFKLDIRSFKNKGIEFMNPKAAEQSALLRQRIDKMNKESKNRLKAKKSKIQRKNIRRLKEFQKQLMDIDKDPKCPMSRRIKPGNFRHIEIKNSLEPRKRSYRLPQIQTPRSNSLSSRTHDAFHSGELTQEMFNDLSCYISQKYGVSEDILKDVQNFNFEEVKKGINQRAQHKFIIMLKRVIDGKTKTGGTLSQKKKKSFYPNSTIKNFLDDLLGQTKNKYINNQMRIFRNSVMSKDPSYKKVPHVFNRMQDDVRRRENDSDQFSKSYFKKN